MKPMFKIVSAIALVLVAWGVSFHVVAADILGGGGNAAEKLIMEWAKAKPGNQVYPVKFSSSVASNDLPMLQIGKIDFAILDTPLSNADLAKMKLMQFPFALSGIAIVVNFEGAISSTLKLDSLTLGKIFSGEIATWNNPAVTALNPRQDLPNKPIIVIHSGDFSTDYPVLNSYIGNVNEKWRSGDLNGKKRLWPENSVYTDGFSARISTIKNTPYSIGFLPMQYLPSSALSAVHISNRDGKFVGLSDVSIVASAAAVSFDDGNSDNLSLINKSGKSSWPISTFSFIVVNKDKVNDAKISELLNVIGYGLKFGSLTPIVHNYVQLPGPIAKSVMAKIENLGSESGTSTAGKSSQDKAGQAVAQEALAAKKRNEEESRRLRSDANNAAQDESRRNEERNRVAKLQAEQKEREQAVREAKAAKIAADEAIKAANAARVQAELLAEKNRLIAKAEKNKLDMEKAEKQRIAEAKAEKERELQLRNQKDEDPLEAYRRSVSQ